jgi:uncharacterized protein YjbI with pentapeptide repeats
MNSHPPKTFGPALLLFVFGAICSAPAQRAFKVSVSPTNSANVAIRWKAQSATPVGDLFIVPQFQVQRSTNLQTWTPITSLLTPALSQIVTVVDTNPGPAFYRVQSIIEKPYAQLNQAKLASGGFAGADFFGASLFAADLTDSDLTGASLSAADVRSADFTGADLRGADIFGAQASAAIFDSATLGGADASFSTFEGADLFNCDLTHADLSFSILTGADLRFAMFWQTTMDSNTLIDPQPKLIWQIVNTNAAGAFFTNKDLSVSSLTNKNFNGTRFNASDLSATDFSGSDLRGANFTNAVTRFMDLHNTLMDGATIIDSKSRLVWQILNQPAIGRDLHNTNLSSVLLTGANLISANVSNAVCTTSVFEFANFGNANMQKISCNQADFFSAILTNANMSLGQFQFADFTSANLRNAVTNGANFSGAIWGNTIMPDGSIRNF